MFWSEQISSGKRSMNFSCLHVETWSAFDLVFFFHYDLPVINFLVLLLFVFKQKLDLVKSRNCDFPPKQPVEKLSTFPSSSQTIYKTNSVKARSTDISDKDKTKETKHICNNSCNEKKCKYLVNVLTELSWIILKMYKSVLNREGYSVRWTLQNKRHIFLVFH